MGIRNKGIDLPDKSFLQGAMPRNSSDSKDNILRHLPQVLWITFLLIFFKLV